VKNQKCTQSNESVFLFLIPLIPLYRHGIIKTCVDAAVPVVPIAQHPSAPHKGIRFHYPHFPVSHRTLIPVCMFRWAFKRACQYLVDILGGLPRHNKAREETDSRSYFYTPDHLKAPFPHAAPILAHGCGTHKQ
jgi:hypothetical protein